MNTINTTKEVKEFCERVGITPTQFTGEDPIKGNLIIEDDVTIPPGFAPRVTGYMILRHVTTLSPGFAPQVGDFLKLVGISHIPAGFVPVVGESLYLSSATTIGNGFAPIVGGLLWLDSVTTIGNGFAPIVGTALDLGRVTTIGRDFAPIVGRSLYLACTNPLPKGFAPIVGRSLFLGGAVTIPSGCSPIVGDTLYLKGGKTAEVKKLDTTKPIEGQGGKYIIADDLLTEVVSKRGNVWRVRNIGGGRVFYLVTDGAGKFAHGDTLKEARESLTYKISDRDTSEYEDLSQDSELTFAAAIKMYRTITGACATGTRHFVESNKIEKKNYTIREIINMTSGQYGHEQLVKFFRS